VKLSRFSDGGSLVEKCYRFVTGYSLLCDFAAGLNPSFSLRRKGVMKCPRTGTPLKSVEIHGIVVDISEACGGVWFDNYELQKFDEVHEAGGDELEALMEQYRDDKIDRSARIYSPKHPEVMMMRRFFSARKEVEIDVCPMSGGVWLDAGELAKIRMTFPKESDREEATKAFVDKVTDQTDMAENLRESRVHAARARQFAHFFKWICPSHHIPGKQEGGAF